MYYNTTSETGATLKRAHHKVTRQEKYVLGAINDIDPNGDGFTTDELCNLIIARIQVKFERELREKWDAQDSFDDVFQFIREHYSRTRSVIISVRRSVTDLKDAGFIEITDKKRKGSQGVNNRIYRRSKEFEEKAN